MSQLFWVLGAPPPGGVCAGLVAPAAPDLGAPPQVPRGVCAGRWPLRPLIWALRPKSPGEFVRGWWPLRPLIWALRPKSPGEFVRGWWPLRPTMQALRPKPRVTFVSRRKSPKACQNLRFWTPSRFQQNFGNLTQSGSRDGTLALSDWKPQPSLSALFALAYASRRAAFCH